MPNESAWLQRTFPHFNHSPDVYREAVAHTQRMKALAKRSGPEWEFAGPGNIGGRIVDVAFDEATFAIDEGVAIPDDSAAVVASEGLLGGTFVEIVPGGSFEMYADGAVIEDTQSAVSLITLLLKFVSGGDGE